MTYNVFGGTLSLTRSVSPYKGLMQPSNSLKTMFEMIFIVS